MKKTKNISDNIVNNWFDSENARLIILCATLGIFGAHKFAQRKIGQGILFLLLDLTVFGLIISFIWAFLGLIFLTAKPNNKPGNMILGSVFILVNLYVSVIASSADLFLGLKKDKPLVPEYVIFDDTVGCDTKNGNHKFGRIDITATTKKLDLIVGTNVITIPVKVNSKNTIVYEGDYSWKSGDARLSAPSKDNEKFIVKINKEDGQSVDIVVGLGESVHRYGCFKLKNW